MAIELFGGVRSYAYIVYDQLRGLLAARGGCLLCLRGPNLNFGSLCCTLISEFREFRGFREFGVLNSFE
jgi:hypothetical protein